ncbi:guanylate cyclase 32E-like [Dreissena polymorpha]|nr:guanylate cyclase 32E-like [Dreissena polymorpha]
MRDFQTPSCVTWRTLTFWSVSLAALSWSASAVEDTRVPLKISFLTSSGDLQGSKTFAGAFFSALDIVNQNKSLLPGYRLECLFNDTDRSSLNAINAMTSHYGNEIIAFIGPDESCHCESTVAAAWNLPMIGYKCHDSKSWSEEDMQTRRTFATTQPSTAKVSKSILAILQYYQWSRVTMVVGASSIWNETAESLKTLMKDHNIRLHDAIYFPEPYASGEDIMYPIVEKSYRVTRIYVFLGDHHGLIDFSRLLKAHVEDRISEYVVIAVYERLYTEDPHSYLLKTPFESKDDLNTYQVQSFETVLLLVPRPPLNDDWDHFLDDVRRRNTQPPINGFAQVYKGSAIKVPIYAAFLYDALHTYALALHETLTSGGDMRNGKALIAHIRNTTYTSILGYDVYIDRQGDAEGNYTLLTFDVHQPDSKVELIPVGNFRMTQGGVGIPELNLFRDIKWRNGGPPRDEPKCGFHGEKCEHKSPLWTILSVVIAIAVIVGIAADFGVRHFMYEQKLARLLWKVDFKDIAPLVHSVDENLLPPNMQKRKRSKSHPFKFIFSYDNESERTTLLGEEVKRDSSFSSARAQRCLIGCYKGTVVSIKHISKPHVEIDRDLKKQLQLRKELNHDNVARFIGACVESPHVYILTQFCQRGSLQDILNNEDFSLDDMFVSSLVSDLIKGMTFIHDSEIHYHGNLKTSNCLVDAHWVLMVTDFGIHRLGDGRASSSPDPQNYYETLLWRAPEVLRSTSREAVGTQKADVYAFSLILYALIGRKGPWGDTEYSSKEMIELLRSESPSIRPEMASLACEPYISGCIRDCWAEDPDMRPSFKDIRVKLKPMLQGIKSNILDNMLWMMELYSNNLESLVADRTELLFEEKKMTENLLLRMLPRFVAERLKKGEPVVPEVYESVSIYFSDIVGFTALSAESTPMEVVCMLNDLYTCFDAIVENFDVYKIETIGDAYFVVSGLPLRNDDLHAGEIASMSLRMLQQIKRFKIRHRPNDTLKLRIGLHSGPCVAGVVGLKMPRYTLFGDTVNTASRMESTGVPLKIHCSETITCLLRKLGGYQLTERGLVNAKGKGEMLTYFLEGEDESHRQRRISNTRLSGKITPNGDLNPAGETFGAPIIIPLYWTNGFTNSSRDLSPVFPNYNPNIPLIENCASPEENLFDKAFNAHHAPSQKGMQRSGSTQHPHALNSTCNLKLQDLTTGNQAAKLPTRLGRQISESVDGRQTSETLNKITLGLLHRNVSFPSNMIAEDSV